MSAPRADRGYRLAAIVVKPLMRAWFRIRVRGQEHIPPSGPAILAANHRSNMDPVLLACALRRPVFFMAKAELFVFPLGPVLRWIGQFPVRRGGADREALRRTKEVLLRGDVLGLFPEGTRGDGRFAAVHPGLCYILLHSQAGGVAEVAMPGAEVAGAAAAPVPVPAGELVDLPAEAAGVAALALPARAAGPPAPAGRGRDGGCPVLPVAIFGTERIRRRFGWLPFAAPVRIVVGPPLHVPDLGIGRSGRRAATEQLREVLQGFLAGIGAGVGAGIGAGPPRSDL